MAFEEGQSFGCERIQFVTEDQYRTLKFNSEPAYTIAELMAPGVLQGGLPNKIYVWNNDNGWTGDEGGAGAGA